MSRRTRGEMSRHARGKTSSFDWLHWISNALKDLSGVVRELDARTTKVGGGESKMASIYHSVSSATWPCKLRNQMASRTLHVLEHPAGAHCDFHPPAKPFPFPCNRVTYSNPSDPPALSRILSSIRGVLFPPIIVFPFIAINVNRGTLVYVDIFTIRRYGESRTVMYNGTWEGITRNASRGYCFYYHGWPTPIRKCLTFT